VGAILAFALASALHQVLPGNELFHNLPQVIQSSEDLHLVCRCVQPREICQGKAEGRDYQTRQPFLSPWIPIPETSERTIHARADGSFQESAGAGWLVTRDAEGRGPALTQAMKVIGTEQTAFGAEVVAIEAVVR